MRGREAVRVTIHLYGDRVAISSTVLEWTDRGRKVIAHTMENSALVGACGLDTDEVRARIHALVLDAVADMPMGNEASDL